MNLATNNATHIEETTESFKIVENETLTVFVDSHEAFDFFSKAGYDSNKKALTFSTSEKTNQIRIYDHLQSLIYKLPVQSDEIRIGQSLFDQGEYSMVFDVKGDRKMFISRLEVH
mgnify:CR=1 FL=1